ERRHGAHAPGLQLHLRPLRVEALVGEVPRRPRAAAAAAVVAAPQPLDLRSRHPEPDAAEAHARHECAALRQHRGGEDGEQAHASGILARMDVFNIFRAEVEYTKDATQPDGYDCGGVRVGPKVGASRLGLSVYELPTGQAICPYHFEWTDEEWLVVRAGHPTPCTPAGERETGRGDTGGFAVR